MNEELRAKLLAMAAEDKRVRDELAASGELFEGYHPKMEKVHLENAAALEKMLDQNKGAWTGEKLVGKDGAEAAWLIVQHSISLPDFQRKCLSLITEAVEKGEAEAYQRAYLYDRICFFEDRPQRYGTQSDWNENGEMEVHRLEDEERVNDFRREAGLEPLKSKITQMGESELKPRDWQKRRREGAEWARRVGWRK